SFNADVKITSVEGKVFPADTLMLSSLLETEGVVSINEVIEEEALLTYHNQQTLATVKGVSPQFAEMSGLDTLLYMGEMKLHEGGIDYIVMGAGVAYRLSVNIYDQKEPVLIYLPNRFASSGDMLNAFNTKQARPSGFYQIQQELDEKYAIVPIDLMRSLLDFTNEVTALEIATKKSYKYKKITDDIKALLGPDFNVKNRFQQQELIYKIIRSEKWATFFILSFILLLAVFNIIGTQTMLILEKKKDIAVLQSMGATNRLIRRVFILEGLMISFAGTAIGLLVGGTLAWLQQRYGIIGISGAETMVIDAYPVKINGLDFVLVFATVMAIGYFAAWYPVRKLSKRVLDIKLG
ncbi:MAG: FtsX-like permease family protein, partial [Bacteroidales bacterium]|nr:FtsX-like permease family protein [Bacteroidales bacterium]